MHHFIDCHHDPYREEVLSIKQYLFLASTLCSISLLGQLDAVWIQTHLTSLKSGLK